MAAVSFDIPTNLPDAGLLAISAQGLVNLPELSDREEAVQTLFKLIDGILATPEDAKKRRVKKSNEVIHRKVGRHPAAIDFLRAAGFKEEDDPDTGPCLHMPVAYLSRLTDAHHTLAQVASEAGLAAPALPATQGGAFNPFQSTSQAVDTTRRAPGSEKWKSEADRVRDEVRKKELENKEKVDLAPPVPLNPSAFWLSAGRRLEDVIRDGAEELEAGATDNALIQEQVAAAKSCFSGAQTFQSADKKRLDDLSKKRVHERCILRVVCPDKSVLQVTFRSGDKGEHVLTQIAPLLAPHIRDKGWYLYQSPPLKRLAPRETMAKAGFTPGANVYLGFDDEKPGPPFLEDYLVAQLGPAPAANRGVTSAGGFEVGRTFNGEAMGWGTGQKLGGAGDGAAVAGAPVAATPNWGGGHRLGGGESASASAPPAEVEQ